MKKLLVLAVALITVSAVNAQKHGKESKDYSSYLPKKGDIAIGVDLAGMVKFVGNSFADSKTEGNAVAPFEGDLFAKYFLTDKIALRAHLTLGVSNYNTRRFVRDDAAWEADNNSDAELTDLRKVRRNNFEIAVGAEFRRSLRRVQGYVGAEAFIGSYSEKEFFEYGNPITLENRNPSSYNFNGNIQGGQRLLENKPSTTVGGGLAIFTGVDYFISRNVSLGFEFSLAGAGYSTKITKVTYEEWDTTENAYKKTTDEEYPKQNRFNITPHGFVNLMFYF